MMRFVAALLVVFLLSACGFTPMYGSSGAAYQAQGELQDIAIDIIPDREGQYLRNRLIDRFHMAGTPQSPRYVLRLSPVLEERTNLDITKTADTTRAQLRLSTRMVLREAASGKDVLTRDLHAITSYNILASQFTTRVSEDNARLNALDDLARQAEQQIVLHLRR